MISLKQILLEANINKELFQIIDSKYPEFLDKVKSHPNFVVLQAYEVDRYPIGKPNQCEQNTLDFIKRRLEYKDNVFPVGGYLLAGDNLHPVEHYWVYDKSDNEFLEVTPVRYVKGYIGIINYDINDSIKNAINYWDVDFFKGGHVYSKYFK